MTKETPEALFFDRKGNAGVKQEQTIPECIEELKNYQKVLIEKGAVPNLGEPTDSTSTEKISYWDMQKKIEELVISPINSENAQSLYNRAQILIANLENSRSISETENI